MSQYLSEAFKKLSALNEDTFSINDSGLDDFIKFSEEDEIDDTIDVIDPEAETLDDLEDSYVGKVILDCCVCHSKLYKDVEDVVIDGDIANANEECPFCYTTDGFKVIGQVAPFDEEETEEHEESEETEEHEDKDKNEEKEQDEEKDESLKEFVNNESKSITEDINNLSLDTDDTHMEMTSNEDGKVTISTEPITNAKAEDEIITPLEPEVQDEIDSNVEDGGEIEIDMDEFDEDSFDELGEGYLKKVYENVNSFKTSNVSFLKDKLILEGVIKFNSGNSKKTNFVFGIREATKSGKVRFIGENKEIARGRKSFTITGRIKNKKFLSESFNYNYGVRNAKGKAQRLYGTIKTSKRG